MRKLQVEDSDVMRIAQPWTVGCLPAWLQYQVGQH
jgi:hypothetical protein